MFADPAMAARLRMCGDCRVIAQTESKLDPYAGAPRPHPRTTDEYEAAHDLPPGQTEAQLRSLKGGGSAQAAAAPVSVNHAVP